MITTQNMYQKVLSIKCHRFKARKLVILNKSQDSKSSKQGNGYKTFKHEKVE